MAGQIAGNGVPLLAARAAVCRSVQPPCGSDGRARPSVLRLLGAQLASCSFRVATRRAGVGAHAKVPSGAPRHGRQILRSVLVSPISGAPALTAPRPPLAAVRSSSGPPLAPRHTVAPHAPVVSPQTAPRAVGPAAGQAVAAGAPAGRAARAVPSVPSAASPTPVPSPSSVYGPDEAQEGWAIPVREGGPRPVGRATFPSARRLPRPAPSAKRDT